MGSNTVETSRSGGSLKAWECFQKTLGCCETLENALREVFAHRKKYASFILLWEKVGLENLAACFWASDATKNWGKHHSGPINLHQNWRNQSNPQLFYFDSRTRPMFILSNLQKYFLLSHNLQKERLLNQSSIKIYKLLELSVFFWDNVFIWQK